MTGEKGPSLDHCPGCAGRVMDYDPGSYENEDGQRGHFVCKQDRAERLAIAQRVHDYAHVHYEDGGWDVLVECHTVESLAYLIWIDEDSQRISTYEQALQSLADGCVAIWADRQADARNSAF